jgi:hypothetical protein
MSANEHTCSRIFARMPVDEPAPTWRPDAPSSLCTPMRESTDFRKNQLLASLPDSEWQRWSSALEPIQMPLGEVLYEPGVALNFVYFPMTSIVSLLYVMENGASAEIAVVGNEGIVGVSLFMGGESTPSRAVVQSAGAGCRLKAQLMKDEFNRAGPVLHLLADGADGCLQSASYPRPAAVPLAAIEPGSTRRG